MTIGHSQVSLLSVAACWRSKLGNCSSTLPYIKATCQAARDPSPPIPKILRLILYSCVCFAFFFCFNVSVMLPFSPYFLSYLIWVKYRVINCFDNFPLSITNYLTSFLVSFLFLSFFSNSYFILFQYNTANPLKAELKKQTDFSFYFFFFFSFLFSGSWFSVCIIVFP